MRPDHQTLRGRFATLDARLARPPARRALAVVLATLLAVEAAVVLDRTVAVVTGPPTATTEAGGTPATFAVPATPFGAPSTGAHRDDAAPAADTDAPTELEDEASPAFASPAAPPSPGPTASPLTVTEPDPGGDAGGGSDAAAGSSSGSPSDAPPVSGAATSPPPASDPARDRFDAAFPAQAGAEQSTARPDTTRWAVLVGINDHQGRTRDNLGSRQDAEDLARHLRSLGWRDDHIVLLTDRAATREAIVEAFRWLARKTDRDSVVVIHYSGHTKQWHGRDVDGDGEVTDEGLWPSDNRFITDREVGELMSRIRAGRLWLNVGACEAAGFDDPGITGPGRIATYSSGEHEKSYEDPSVGNSVWGHHLIEEGLVAGHGDGDGDGTVTVEEAFRFAAPRATQRTRGQPQGHQTPVVVDRLEGDFDLRIPPPPRPEPSSSPSDRPCTLLCPSSRGASTRQDP